WHLGPVAVDSHLQGRGVGGIMLAAFSARMDDCRTLAYLETDRSENVRFYQKFGFKVVAEAEVLGERNWFMSRPAPIPNCRAPRGSRFTLGLLFGDQERFHQEERLTGILCRRDVRSYGRICPHMSAWLSMTRSVVSCTIHAH